MARATSEDVRHAARVLAGGGLVAFPTETVYGLGADASSPAAVRRVFEVKGRPRGHPLIVHLPDGAALDEWSSAPPTAARALGDAFWPGPLTLLVPRSRLVVDEVTGGGDVVGLRVPDHPLALELLREFGGGVAAPSANRFGQVSPTTAEHVLADLGDDVDVVLDGGPCSVGVESTIVDCTTRVPEIIRPGGVTAAQLAAVLGTAVGTWAGERAVPAPGTLRAHYAPAAEVAVVPDESAAREVAAAAVREGRSVVVLAPQAVPGLPAGAEMLAPAGDSASYARVLYDRLREADARAADLLVAVPPADAGIGRAVRDRLLRAAASNT